MSYPTSREELEAHDPDHWTFKNGTPMIYVDPARGCWIWMGYSYKGYGRIAVKREHAAWKRKLSTTPRKYRRKRKCKSKAKYPTKKGTFVCVQSHQYFYFVKYGQVPVDKQLAHTCHRRMCCNPDHLRLDTSKGNASDWYIDQKLSAEQIEQIYEMYDGDLPVSSIAARFCVPRPYIYRLLNDRPQPRLPF